MHLSSFSTLISKCIHGYAFVLVLISAYLRRTHAIESISQFNNLCACEMYNL